MFENGNFPVINRPTRVTSASATAIDHILTNTIRDQDLENVIIDISDHFPIFTILNSKAHNQPVNKSNNINTIHKRSVVRKLQKDSFFDELE